MTLDNNGWQRERADIISQLAVLNQKVSRVEVQVDRISANLECYSRDHAMDEVRREVVKELFGAVEEVQRNLPEKLRERLEEMEKYKPLNKAVLWAMGVLTPMVIALVFKWITGT